MLEGRANESDFDAAADALSAAMESDGAPEGEVDAGRCGARRSRSPHVKALHALQDADVIFYDELVTPEILDRARRDAARVRVGRRKGQPGEGQQNINAHMIAAARAGKRVVRLKGGDPFIFGRGGEEVEALRAAGVRVRVVPGITAALGCAAEAELPLTFRSEATRLTLVTAHGADEDAPIDWSATERSRGDARHLHGPHGSDECERRPGRRGARSRNAGGRARARHARGCARRSPARLRELPALAARAGEGPALIVVGDVVARSRPWLENAEPMREAV